MPSAPRKRSPPSGLRIRVDSNASISSLLPTTGSQLLQVLDTSPIALSAAETLSSPPTVDQVTMQIDDAPTPVAQVAQPSERVPLPFPRPKRTSGRKMEQLSLQLPLSAASDQSSFSISPPLVLPRGDSNAASNVAVHERPQSYPRRPLTRDVTPTPAFSRAPFHIRSSSNVAVTSVASLTVSGHVAAAATSMPESTSAFVTRGKEVDHGAPYADGPIQILPGIWLGQEESALSWPDLEARGIRWVLNVAKEVAPPYLDDANTPLVDLRNPPMTTVANRLHIQPGTSNPDLGQPRSAFISRRQPVPAPGGQLKQQPPPRAVQYTPPTGGAPLLYVHLPWSHGQSDLVKSGFPAAMSFVDHAQSRGQGVLIHCQCGVSRSATLAIALVMRASMAREGYAVPEELKSIQGSVQNAYAYVKEKSQWIGPNMSLLYQLLEYESLLVPKKNTTPVPSEDTDASEEEEWSRRRLAMEREEVEAEAATATARKAGLPTPLLLNRPSPGPAAWGGGFLSRKHAGSVHSTFTTSSSVISEDPLEDDEGSEDGETNITVVPRIGEPVRAQSIVNIQSEQLSCKEMFQYLIDHGCADLSSDVDPEQNSTTRLLGGAFGDIWKGKLRDGTEVAIKVWRLGSMPQDGPKPLKRAMREIYHWSKVKHENIQELMGIVIFQGQLGMVSLWMEHGNLRDYLRKNPDANRLSLGIQVAAGLSYLHGCNMVHGDLKAMNVLVSQDCIVKISDFDHSILSECTLVFSNTTNVGGGTLRWMAPELLLSSEEDGSPPARRNKQSDVYALGMTVLEIITGDIPYSEYRNDHGVYRALDKQKYPKRPTELLDLNEWGPETWDLLLECWDHNPSARPSSSEVYERLNSIKGGATA